MSIVHLCAIEAWRIRMDKVSIARMNRKIVEAFVKGYVHNDKLVNRFADVRINGIVLHGYCEDMHFKGSGDDENYFGQQGINGSKEGIRLLTFKDLKEAAKSVGLKINKEEISNQSESEQYQEMVKRNHLTNEIDNLLVENGFFDDQDLDEGSKLKWNVVRKQHPNHKQTFLKWLNRKEMFDITKITDYTADKTPNKAVNKVLTKHQKMQQEVLKMSMNHLVDVYIKERKDFDPDISDKLTGYSNNVSIIELCKVQAMLTFKDKPVKQADLIEKLDSLKKRLDRENPKAQTNALKNLLLYTANKIAVPSKYTSSFTGTMKLCSQSKNFLRVKTLLTEESNPLDSEDVDERQFEQTLDSLKIVLIEDAASKSPSDSEHIKDIQKKCKNLGYKYGDEAIKVLIEAAQQVNDKKSTFYKKCGDTSAKEVLKEMVFGGDKSSAELIRVKQAMGKFGIFDFSFVYTLHRHIFHTKENAPKFASKVKHSFENALARVKQNNTSDDDTPDLPKPNK